MYHSITFGDISSGAIVGKNTWTDWHLIPSSRPTVAQAPVTTNYISIPGKEDGPIDFSTYLTGSIQYGNRSGTFEFLVDNGHEYWEDIRYKIVNYLHGKELKMVLEDDPSYYYKGVFTLNEWKSESWNSSISINYILEPYKYLIASGSSWLWDPFNFETGNTSDVASNKGWL